MSTASNGAPPVASNAGVEKASASPEGYYALMNWLREGGTSAIAPCNVGVTSCTSGSGVSTVAHNLAIAAAKSCEQPVLLLDLSGIASVRASRPKDESCRQPLLPEELARVSALPNLFVLRAVDVQNDARWSANFSPFELLASALEDQYGYVVVDLPTTESNMCCQAAGLLDGVLLVIEAERTCSAEATRAKNRLLRAHANLPGVLFNNYSEHLPKWLEARC